MMHNQTLSSFEFKCNKVFKKRKKERNRDKINKTSLLNLKKKKREMQVHGGVRLNVQLNTNNRYSLNNYDI